MGKKLKIFDDYEAGYLNDDEFNKEMRKITQERDDALKALEGLGRYKGKGHICGSTLSVYGGKRPELLSKAMYLHHQNPSNGYVYPNVNAIFKQNLARRNV